MKISSKELEASKVRVIVDKNPVATSFEKWAQPGHFSRTLAKGPKTTTWIWNLHADAHDFDSQTSSLEDISRKIFSAHFGQLSLIFIWISQAYFHGARFSNYSAWLSNPTTVKQSSQVVWPVVGQEILNGDVGGGFSGVQVTSGFFELWRAAGITNETELYWTAMGALGMSALMVFAGWFHYHKAAPKLEWFQNVESMMNHHLAGLLGLGCLSWSGHQIHISLPINKLLDAGVAPQEIPLPHELLFNQDLMAQLYPSFKKGLLPFFTLNWSEYSDFLTFKGGLNPITGSLWLTDQAHHHLALAVLFIFAGHMYRTNWSIGHSMKEILEAHKGPLTGEGHKGLFEILTKQAQGYKDVVAAAGGDSTNAFQLLLIEKLPELVKTQVEAVKNIKIKSNYVKPYSNLVGFVPRLNIFLGISSSIILTIISLNLPLPASNIPLINPSLLVKCLNINPSETSAKLATLLVEATF